MDRDDLADVRAAGLRLLARREHSAKELSQKLQARGYEPAQVEAVIAQLRSEGLLSERRFAEEFVRARRNRGYGPMKIRAELSARGVDPAVADSYLQASEEEWQALALAQYKKRFGGQIPASPAERGKHYRFLSSRGFTAEQIRRVLDGRA